jgi:hypothetical protein
MRMREFGFQVKDEHVYGNFKLKPGERSALKAPTKWRQRREGMSEAHLALIRKLPCAVCPSRRGIQCHHLKAVIGAKRQRGVALRSTDQFAVPLCGYPHHFDVERLGSRREIRWFRENGIFDVEELATALWRASGDFDKMLAILAAHKQAPG